MTTFARLMIAFGLATASLTSLDPSPAAACGGYTSSPEDEIIGLAWTAVADEPGALIEAVRWRDDGSVEVEVSWATYVPGQVIAQYLYFARDELGVWEQTSHSYKFTMYRDHSADARKPTPRKVAGPRQARVAKR